MWVGHVQSVEGPPHKKKMDYPEKEGILKDKSPHTHTPSISLRLQRSQYPLHRVPYSPCFKKVLPLFFKILYLDILVHRAAIGLSRVLSCGWYQFLPAPTWVTFPYASGRFINAGHSEWDSGCPTGSLWLAAQLWSFSFQVWLWCSGQSGIV